MILQLLFRINRNRLIKIAYLFTTKNVKNFNCYIYYVNLLVTASAKRKHICDKKNSLNTFPILLLSYLSNNYKHIPIFSTTFLVLLFKYIFKSTECTNQMAAVVNQYAS